jgi:gluconate 2-dehydrogenase alpha chain
MAMQTGNYDVRYGARVTGIMIGNDGLATGLRYIDLETGEEHEQPADIVILSGYILTNVRMLLLSGNGQHPDGVGNSHGMVGKNYTYQLSGSPANGLFEGVRMNAYMGHAGVAQAIQEFNADNYDHSDLDFIGGASITCGGGAREPITSTTGLMPMDAELFEEYADREANFSLGPAIPAEQSDLAGAGVEWGQSWKDNLRRNWDSVHSIGIQGESLPYEDQFLDLDPHFRDAFGQPLLRITYDFHENDYRLYEHLAARCIEIMEAMEPTRMTTSEELSPYNIHDYQSTHNTGGAIMGATPETSVTNRYGQVWDTPNVFVTGAALYPQNPGFNPTGTLLALAYMTCDAMVERVLDHPDRLLD